MAHCSNSCPLSWWCYLTISSCAALLLFLQSFPASGSFPVSQLFAPVGQSIVASASASVLAINVQHWFPLGLTDLISLLSKKPSRVFSSTTVWKHPFFITQPYLRSTSHIHTWLLENHHLCWLLILSGVKSAASVCRAGHCELWFLLHVVAIGPLLFFLMPSHLYKTGSALQVCVKWTWSRIFIWWPQRLGTLVTQLALTFLVRGILSDAGLKDGMMPPKWQCLGMVKLLRILQIFLELFLLLITV